MESLSLGEKFNCAYCNVTFNYVTKLREHCQTEEHISMVLSDKGRDWYFRPPPRGVHVDNYILCKSMAENNECTYGTSCIEAHDEAELEEWKRRFQYREMRLQKAKQSETGKSYKEEIIQRIENSGATSELVKRHLDGIEISCNCNTNLSITSKGEQHWIFTIKTSYSLKGVLLIYDKNRSHFNILKIRKPPDLNSETFTDAQEWIAKDNQPLNETVCYEVTIGFKSEVFGTFRQTLLFDFGLESYLVQNLCVDVVSEENVSKLEELRDEVKLVLSERWSAKNSCIVPFTSSSSTIKADTDFEKILYDMYPTPYEENVFISQESIGEKLSVNNYATKMHELLQLEEVERFGLISKYNAQAKLSFISRYILSPNSTSSSVAKFAPNDELFGALKLNRDLSEDSYEGKMLLMHCYSIYFTLIPKGDTVYEAHIEDKTKDIIYLRISAKAVADMKLQVNTTVNAEIQFQMNRLQFCEWNYAVDNVNKELIFPPSYLFPHIPWSPERQWPPNLEAKINTKQKEAIVAMTSPLDCEIPPLIIVGPYGTGKTFTLAQGVKELIRNKNNRVLLCTHSNSAADLYIKDYFHEWNKEGSEKVNPLRVYYEMRWVNTVHPVVQKYCLIQDTPAGRKFTMPTRSQLEEHNIVVATLSTSLHLYTTLKNGHFTHILIDEAAQVLECEAVIPLLLANKSTRIVLAGDHQQVTPHVFSSLAKENNFHASLLERLYYLYPKGYPCKIMLVENYRSHKEIINFTSDAFYDQKLVCSAEQVPHPKYFPLTFFTCSGEDIQDTNSTAFYNNSEICEVVERVKELKKQWPDKLWGPFNEHSIGVVTPYTDQVFRIRAVLRKHRIDNVCVERVQNVQGKQFRVIVLSTVRTRKTCAHCETATDVNLGFLSESKLLNTAITRAQSLVAVVGDPVSLASVGTCRKLWDSFIKKCDQNESLFGTTYAKVERQLDGIELRKIYSLNPLAEEFVPRARPEFLGGYPLRYGNPNQYMAANNIATHTGHVPIRMVNNSVPRYAQKPHTTVPRNQPCKHPITQETTPSHSMVSKNPIQNKEPQQQQNGYLSSKGPSNTKIELEKDVTSAQKRLELYGHNSKLSEFMIHDVNEPVPMGNTLSGLIQNALFSQHQVNHLVSRDFGGIPNATVPQQVNHSVQHQINHSVSRDFGGVSNATVPQGLQGGALSRPVLQPIQSLNNVLDSASASQFYNHVPVNNRYPESHNFATPKIGNHAINSEIPNGLTELLSKPVLTPSAQYALFSQIPRIPNQNLQGVDWSVSNTNLPNVRQNESVSQQSLFPQYPLGFPTLGNAKTSVSLNERFPNASAICQPSSVVQTPSGIFPQTQKFGPISQQFCPAGMPPQQGTQLSMMPCEVPRVLPPSSNFVPFPSPNPTVQAAPIFESKIPFDNVLHLVPHNMSLIELAAASKEYVDTWCNHIRQTQGEQNMIKLRYILSLLGRKNDGNPYPKR